MADRVDARSISEHGGVDDVHFAKAPLFRTSRILTLTPLTNKPCCRNSSTWSRSVISTT